MDNYYKIFFTIYFDYSDSKNKTITKFFKSDVDISSTNFSEKVSDKNIYKLWENHAEKKPLNDLNPDLKYDDKKAKNKKVITHRIVNLKTLSEVFLR